MYLNHHKRISHKNIPSYDEGVVFQHRMYISYLNNSVSVLLILISKCFILHLILKWIAQSTYFFVLLMSDWLTALVFCRFRMHRIILFSFWRCYYSIFNSFYANPSAIPKIPHKHTSIPLRTMQLHVLWKSADQQFWVCFEANTIFFSSLRVFNAQSGGSV